MLAWNERQSAIAESGLEHGDDTTLTLGPERMTLKGAHEMTTPKIAIVTGGGRGIGAAVGRRMAQDGLGVALIDLSTDDAEEVAREIRENGGRALAVKADVSDEAAVEAAVTQIADELGPPLVLVNNAGITRDNLLFKLTTEEWDAVMNVHLRGAFLMSRAVQRYMVDAGWGRIVNLSSTSALGNRGQANYAAAKAGMQGFTKTVAIELGRYGVTCNAIAPGFIVTEMTAATAERMGISFEEFQEQALASIPVRRVGRPEDIAALAAFFVREDAGFISGQVVYAAGGPRT